jgi:hypothetical protein
VWSVKGSRGRQGAASECVRAARSVAVRSSRVSVAERAHMKRESEYRDRNG